MNLYLKCSFQFDNNQEHNKYEENLMLMEARIFVTFNIVKLNKNKNKIIL